MELLLRIAVRIAYYPTLWMNRALSAAGFWNRWDWVDPSVLVGAVPTRGDLPRLHALGVRAIVNMCEEFGGYRREMQSRGITQLYLPTIDYHCPSEENLWRGIAFITGQVNAGSKVYIHCKAGRGRAATMALCYLMASRRISAKEAFELLRAARPHVSHDLDEREPVLAIQRRLMEGSPPPSPLAPAIGRRVE